MLTEHSSRWIEAGITRPLTGITLDDIPYILKCVTLDSVILKQKAELDQFVDGLEAAGVLKSIQKYPGLWSPMFVASGAQQLTAGMLGFWEVGGLPGRISGFIFGWTLILLRRS